MRSLPLFFLLWFSSGKSKMHIKRFLWSKLVRFHVSLVGLVVIAMRASGEGRWNEKWFYDPENTVARKGRRKEWDNSQSVDRSLDRSKVCLMRRSIGGWVKINWWLDWLLDWSVASVMLFGSLHDLRSWANFIWAYVICVFVSWRIFRSRLCWASRGSCKVR